MKYDIVEDMIDALIFKIYEKEDIDNIIDFYSRTYHSRGRVEWMVCISGKNGSESCYSVDTSIKIQNEDEVINRIKNSIKKLIDGDLSVVKHRPPNIFTFL